MSVGAEVAFWIFAVLGVAGAIGVVAVRNLFRAALLLVMSFFAVAGIYASLSADFMAVAQVLVYMGAISVLIIFAFSLLPLSHLISDTLLSILIVAVYISSILSGAVYIGKWSRRAIKVRQSRGE